jgi:outer membrane immunogenic protein
MRWWVCGLLIAMACPALAADYDDSWLRGSQVIGPAPAPPSRLYRIWAGVYGGAQVGEDFHGVSFDGVPLTPIGSAISQDAILQILQNPLNDMLSFPRVNSKGPSFGGFLGYNWQIDDLVFGVELNANRATLHATETSSATRNYFVVNNANTYAVTLNATSVGTIDMSDYFTARGRLGWAFGNFLPYIVAGISFSRIDSSGYTDINYTGTNVSAACRTVPPPSRPALVSAATTRSPISATANISSASTLPSAWITC